MDLVIMIAILILLVVMMWWQSRKQKKQQQERKDFRANLQPGTEVITIGGVIGKVVSVDTEYEEIVIDSEGSNMRFTFNAISREYIRPAYVHDDEVDENGNPLPVDDQDADADSEQNTQIEAADNTTDDVVNAEVAEADNTTDVADTVNTEATDSGDATK